MNNLSRNIFFFALLFSLNSFAQKNLKEIVENLDKATFTLVAYDEEGKEIGKGGGFFIDPNGLALGRAHIFKDAFSLEAISNEENPMKVLKLHAFEVMGDLALFQVDIGDNSISFFPPEFSSPSVGEEVMVLQDVTNSKSKPDFGNIIRIETVAGFGDIAELEQKVKDENNGAAVLNRDGKLIGYTVVSGDKNILINWNGLSETNAILQNYVGGKQMPAHVRERFKIHTTYNDIFTSILNGYYQSSLDGLKKVMAIEAQDIGGVRNKLAKLYLKAFLENKSEEPENALSTYTEILENDLDNHLVYIQRAQIKIDNGDLRSAAIDLEESLQYGGETADIAKAEADIYTQLDDLESAQKFYAMAEEKGYKGYEIHKEKARMYFKMNEFVEAQMEIDKAMMGNPYDPDLYMLNGKLQAKLGNTEEALASLKKSSDFGASELNVLVEQAEGYILAKDYEQAIKIVQEVIKADTNNLRAIFVRGVAFNQIQNYKRSSEDFDYVLKKDPYHSEAYYERGKAHIALAEYPEAIQDFTRCIKLKPNFDGAYIDRGVTYGLIGEYPSALRDFKTALEIDPESAEATYDLGLTLYNMQRFEESCVTFKKAVELGHEDAMARAEKICAIELNNKTEKRPNDLR